MPSLTSSPATAAGDGPASSSSTTVVREGLSPPTFPPPHPTAPPAPRKAAVILRVKGDDNRPLSVRLGVRVAEWRPAPARCRFRVKAALGACTDRIRCPGVPTNALSLAQTEGSLQRGWPIPALEIG